jgi:hypothetical protein
MSESSLSEIKFDEARAGVVPPGLKPAICQTTSQLCAERCGGMLRAIVLTGSLARDEATFTHEGGRRKLLGDAEFLLVFDQNAVLPSSAIIDQLEGEIEHHLLKGGLSAHVELSPVHTRYLRTMPPAILAYELRTYGQVVWGERQILLLMPAFSPSAIPLEDGWRMLCNRVVECVEVIGPVVERPADPSPTGRYRMIKLYLDMATSLLLFQGAYAPTYRERAERLRALAEDEEVNRNSPFPLRGFAERVAFCTQFKLQGRDSAGGQAAEEGLGGMFSWTELVTFAKGIWRWELERLTRPQDQLPDRELMRRWMRCQPFGARLRGWVSALRRCGWHRSWRQWPRWVRLGWRASPRYWVYAAACELFFRLPDFVKSNGLSPGVDSDLRRIRSWLPVAGDLSGTGRHLGWRDVAADIAWNYRAFLKTTRS